MTAEAWVGVLAGLVTLLNAIWAFVMHGVRSELRTMRAEVTARFDVITTKIDLHVIDRLDRVEHDLTALKAQHAELASQVHDNATAHKLLAQRVQQES